MELQGLCESSSRPGCISFLTIDSAANPRCVACVRRIILSVFIERDTFVAS